MNNDDFFIGWKEYMPPRSRKPIRIFVVGLMAMVAILTLLVVLVQKPFNNHYFKLGETIEVTGTYYDQPVPLLIADVGELSPGLSRSIMLVGYGKFGAVELMQTVQIKTGSLSGKKVTVSGSLIHGDGQTLMELTSRENSLVNVLEDRPVATSLIKAGLLTELRGEVLDPKCYFGVMKPGEGKTHKSCAIRCISGGIPPVLRHETLNTEKPYEYYILLDDEGRLVNERILPYVAEKIRLTGVAASFEDWHILYSDLNTIHNILDE